MDPGHGMSGSVPRCSQPDGPVRVTELRHVVTVQTDGEVSGFPCAQRNGSLFLLSLFTQGKDRKRPL